MDYGFHDKLSLDGQGLVLFFAHVLFVDTVDINLLTLFYSFKNFLFGELFFLLFGLQKSSGLLFSHSFKFLLEFVFVLITSDDIALPFEFGIVHVMLEFLDFFEVLLGAGLLIGHVFLVEDKLRESFLRKVLHFVDDYILGIVFLINLISFINETARVNQSKYIKIKKTIRRASINKNETLLIFN